MLSFGDQINIDCLGQDLIELRSNKNETLIMRCHYSRSMIFAKLNTLLDITAAEKHIRIHNYNDL